MTPDPPATPTRRFAYIAAPDHLYEACLAAVAQVVARASAAAASTSQASSPAALTPDEERVSVPGSGWWTRDLVQDIARMGRSHEADLALTTIAEAAGELVGRSELEQISRLEGKSFDSVFTWLGRHARQARSDRRAKSLQAGVLSPIEAEDGADHHMPLTIGGLDNQTAWAMPSPIGAWWMAARTSAAAPQSEDASRPGQPNWPRNPRESLS